MMHSEPTRLATREDPCDGCDADDGRPIYEDADGLALCAECWDAAVTE